ncbi:MAG: NAD(P)-binding domain-containing protein [Acidobacteriia bacterium]|nr:NAD(P)-binding domain-containing protein [Terriglobia bacterium]
MKVAFIGAGNMGAPMALNLIRAGHDAMVGSETPAIDALARGAIQMSASTLTVALSKELVEAHANRGQGYVASPVLARRAITI